MFFGSVGAGNPFADMLALAVQAEGLGFTGIWTPERHFNAFGGAFPNPAITSAMLAARTSRVAIRSGSVITALHNPVRLVEDWSMIDLASEGRAEMSFTCGWNPNDFSLAPDAFMDRRDNFETQVEQVRKLWREGSFVGRNGRGEDVELAITPRPVSPELNLWLTSAGRLESFLLAGKLGANLLTHLTEQGRAHLGENLVAYRGAFAAHHPERKRGTVAVMLHTYLEDREESAIATARGALQSYLEASSRLEIAGRLAPDEQSEIDDELVSSIAEMALQKLLPAAMLVGSPDSVAPLVASLEEIGVDEIACLCDFGLPTSTIAQSLTRVANLAR
jgi:phthiocerol/phenolphthiocerol synthesis type-I polyketide synthase D